MNWTVQVTLVHWIYKQKTSRWGNIMSICRKVMKIILTTFIWIIRFKLNDQYTLDERTEINVLGFQNELCIGTSTACKPTHRWWKMWWHLKNHRWALEQSNVHLFVWCSLLLEPWKILFPPQQEWWSRKWIDHCTNEVWLQNGGRFGSFR